MLLSRALMVAIEHKVLASDTSKRSKHQVAASRILTQCKWWKLSQSFRRKRTEIGSNGVWYRPNPIRICVQLSVCTIRHHPDSRPTMQWNWWVTSIVDSGRQWWDQNRWNYFIETIHSWTVQRRNFDFLLNWIALKWNKFDIQLQSLRNRLHNHVIDASGDTIDRVIVNKWMELLSGHIECDRFFSDFLHTNAAADTAKNRLNYDEDDRWELHHSWDKQTLSFTGPRIDDKWCVFSVIYRPFSAPILSKRPINH